MSRVPEDDMPAVFACLEISACRSGSGPRVLCSRGTCTCMSKGTRVLSARRPRDHAGFARQDPNQEKMTPEPCSHSLHAMSSTITAALQHQSWACMRSSDCSRLLSTPARGAALEDPPGPPGGDTPPPDGPCNMADGEVCPAGTVCSETDPTATGAECVCAPLSPPVLL